MTTTPYHPLQQTIEAKMREKDTDELIAIWQKPDRQAWSGEAFDAVKKILIERLGYLPNQEDMPAGETDQEKLKADLLNLARLSEGAGFLSSLFYVLAGVGLILWILIALTVLPSPGASAGTFLLSFLILIFTGAFLILFCCFIAIILKAVSSGIRYLVDKEG